MYVTLDGIKMSKTDIKKYNSDKFAFIIYREFLYKLTHVDQFDMLDPSIDSFHKWVVRKDCEVRRRVSNSGCEILYCLVGNTVRDYAYAIPEPWKEIPAVDYKYFKEEITRELSETLYYDEASDDESAWNNRLIRCKLVHNWDDKIIEEFDDFCNKIEGLTIEKNYPYIKAIFNSQKTKDNVFEIMYEEFENDGININYFRKKLEWENVSISEYERHLKITNRI